MPVRSVPRILALFALFEKKRNEVLLVIDKLKHWEP